MSATAQNMGLARINGTRPALLLAAILLLPNYAPAAEADQQLAEAVSRETRLMEEEHRAATRKVVVLPGSAPAGGGV